MLKKYFFLRLNVDDDTDCLFFQSAEKGICFTIASRLKHAEVKQDWPRSIRVVLSVEMTDEDLEDAASVLKDTVEYALQNC